MRQASVPAIADEKRASAHERIDAAFFGINLAFGWNGPSWRLDKFVITWPEGKLVHQVLRLDKVNRRMGRTFRSFVAQIEGNF